MNYNDGFKIGSNQIGICHPTYFIADIAANHDGSLQRAKDLIYLAKEAGSHCAKFQHFKANKIVSDFGFSSIAKKSMSHQAGWHKSVAEIYDDYHTKREWNDELVETCKSVGIEFMTTPYDLEAIEDLIDHVNAVKIGSGDITFSKLLNDISSLNKPILLATGASNIKDVMAAVDVVLASNSNICLMQCNTNYTGDLENFKYVNLNVLKTFATMYPNMPLGFSDHTPGHSAVLGAIALGARVVEKHFTDDNNRVGPDHHFALNPKTWSEMVDRSLEVQASLGNGVKEIEDNEMDTIIIQRRSVRVTRDVAQGEVLSEADIDFLRPCPVDAFSPVNYKQLIGSKLKTGRVKDDYIRASDV
jgi:sialic acid synthase SpsE